MKLVTFGDSWTEGCGSNLAVELTIKDPIEKTKYRNQFAWPNKLSELLSVEHLNFGKGGCSNKEIFDTAVSSIRDGIVNTNDLVIIMWSSSLRDRVPFFVEDEWHVWGSRYKHKTKWFDWLINSTNFTKNPNYNFFLKDYKLFFMDNLYTDYYYHIVNQNYILFLQKLLDFFGIKYIFCDAFDLMIPNDMPKEIDKTQFINSNYYWGFSKKTFKDYIVSIDSTNIEYWEDGKPFGDVVGKHPNRFGYKIIADELYRFILESNVLEKELNKKINLL